MPGGVCLLRRESAAWGEGGGCPPVGWGVKGAGPNIAVGSPLMMPPPFGTAPPAGSTTLGAGAWHLASPWAHVSIFDGEGGSSSGQGRGGEWGVNHIDIPRALLRTSPILACSPPPPPNRHPLVPPPPPPPPICRPETLTKHGEMKATLRSSLTDCTYNYSPCVQYVCAQRAAAHRCVRIPGRACVEPLVDLHAATARAGQAPNPPPPPTPMILFPSRPPPAPPPPPPRRRVFDK